MALPYVTAYRVARPDEAFPLDHPYVAEFYTPILGPTCVALLRWTAGHLTPGKAVPVDLAELAVRLGARSGGFRTPIPIVSVHPFRSFRTPVGRGPGSADVR